MAGWKTPHFDKNNRCSFCRHEAKDHRVVSHWPKLKYHCPDFSLPDIGRDDDPWDPPSSTLPSQIEKLFDSYT